MAAATDPTIPAPMSHPSTTAQQSTYLLPTLRDLFTRSLRNTLSKCSYPAFAACFPTPAAKKPETLKTVWKQIVEKVESKALAEFEAVCVERELDSRFGELEGVLEDAKRRGEAGDGSAENGGVALHTLPPADLFLATLAPQLVSLAERLNGDISQQKKQNETLIQELLSSKKEIESIVKMLEDVVADVEGANKVLYAATKDMADLSID